MFADLFNNATSSFYGDASTHAWSVDTGATMLTGVDEIHMISKNKKYCGQLTGKKVRSHVWDEKFDKW